MFKNFVLPAVANSTRPLAVVLFLATLLTSCFAQEKSRDLQATVFQEKIAQKDEVLLLDVRTMKELEKGMIPGASHIDFYNKDFKQLIGSIDKDKQVYLYCASGGRSSEAANILRSMGYQNVYNLEGGFIAWKLAGLPTTTPQQNATSPEAMSEEAFNGMVKTNPLVLIDFYAPWCAPCKVMKPALDSMSSAMKDSVMILTLNADDNLHLMKALQFNTIPYLMLYKQGKPIEKQSGFASRREMEELIRRHY